MGEQLPDGWMMIHDMAWIGSRRKIRTSYIQADFLLFHPARGVIVPEVKGGAISRQERV